MTAHAHVHRDNRFGAQRSNCVLHPLHPSYYWSISASFGTAPAAKSARAELIHVYAGTITSSPGPNPQRGQCTYWSAARPELTATAWDVRMEAANCRSNLRTFELSEKMVRNSGEAVCPKDFLK